MIDGSLGFTLTRELDATPERIWRAWTDPDELARWWHGRGSTTEAVGVDLRVGGAYRYTMVPDGGEGIVTGGVYSEIAPAERLVFTWGYPDGADEDRPVVAVTISTLGELTRLTVSLTGVEGTSGDGFYYDGWEAVLDTLVEHLGQNEILG